MYEGNSEWDNMFNFSVPLTSVSKMSSGNITWHPPSKVPESSYQGQDECIPQLAQICRILDPGNEAHRWGQEDLCLVLCS